MANNYMYKQPSAKTSSWMKHFHQIMIEFIKSKLLYLIIK